MPAPTPAVGRVAHYVARGSADGVYPPICRAATITEVGDHGTVGLAVLNPTGMFFHPVAAGGCAYDEGDGRSDANMCDGNDHTPGSWHWPARV